MTAPTHSTKRKLSLLQLAEELGNVSKACRIMGYHRDTFDEVRLAGIEVGPSGVRGVWSRLGIETRYKRLMRLEQHAQGDTIVSSENQIRLLERHSVEFRCRHVEARAPTASSSA
jgi:hypothetical protein